MASTTLSQQMKSALREGREEVDDRGRECRKGDIYSCAWLGFMLPGLVEETASYSFCFFGTVVKQSQSYSSTEVRKGRLKMKTELTKLLPYSAAKTVSAC